MRPRQATLGDWAAIEPTAEGCDYFPTPAAAVRALLDACPPPPGPVLEPSAGEGHIVRELVAAGYPVEAVELRQECRGALIAAGAHAVEIADWLSVAAHKRPGSIVGNPPFSAALEHVEACLGTGAGYVALLLRLGFLASQRRAEFHARHPVSALYPLARRPSFSGDGKTDQYDVAWFVWRKDWGPMRYRVI